MPLLHLTHAHFALYRAYLEGFEEPRLHAHYGSPGTDIRITRRTLATLRDTRTISARRAGATHARGLPRPGRPDHVDSERELLALYLARFPPASSPAIDRKVARNRRLHERQGAALAQAALVEAPRPDHGLEGWFAPAVVERLAAVGVMPFG